MPGGSLSAPAVCRAVSVLVAVAVTAVSGCAAPRPADPAKVSGRLGRAERVTLTSFAPASIPMPPPTPRPRAVPAGRAAVHHVLAPLRAAHRPDLPGVDHDRVCDS